MRFSSRRIAARRLVAALCATLVAGIANAHEVPARFRSLSDAAKPDISRVAALRGSEKVQVVVVLSEDSVASARARSSSHTLSAAERSSVEARAADQHAKVRPALEAAGGRVLAQYRHALNGIRLEVDSRQVGALARMPGVVSVLPVGRYHLANTAGVPFIGAPDAWSGPNGLHGEHVKIAIIDTGIDYTHADFGGPGTTAAYTAALASDTLPPDPALFGPNAPKIKGGIDLVGDAYNADPTSATYNPVTAPDANPLDCNSHGTHVAGTAAGFGVTAAGATYNGPYNNTIYGSQAFSVGPGVAPKADLYAVRVFGCTGSTDVVTEAIDWAVKNDMDVISMSLGSDYGTSNTSDALAASNAASAGVIVVAAAGNSGPAPYLLSTPGSGDGVISVAAADARPSFPGATLTLTPGTPVQVQDSNGAPLPASALQIYVLPDGKGGVSLGCNPAEYDPAVVTGKLVVTKRGTCARVDRAIYGQQAGAAAVAMINTSAGYPPYEGNITSNPDTGAAYTVTIPFLGVQPVDATTLVSAASTTFAAVTLANPGYRMAASFSSAGPRYGDSALKPMVTAAGVSVVSAGMGTGNGTLTDSGTSMATPAVSGSAALTLQAHPAWDTRTLVAAIVETADPGKLADYSPRVEGNGVVQPFGAARTHAVVVPRDQPAGTAVSFGFAEFQRDFHGTQVLRVINDGADPITFNVSAAPVGGAPHSVSLSQSTVRVRGNSEALVAVSLSVPVAGVGASHDPATGSAVFQDVAGMLTFTPASAAMNGGITLHLPYYLVPRARSAVRANAPGEIRASSPQSVVRLNNRGAITGSGDFYAWGLSGTRQGFPFVDVRAVGVQSIPDPTTNDPLLVFAVNTFDRFSNAAVGEFDILIDSNGDGVPDYDVVAVDYGYITAGSNNGQMAVVVFDLVNGGGTIDFLADAATDGSTVLLPAFASSIGLNSANPKFSYQVQYYNPYFSGAGMVPGIASFDAFNPAISTAMYQPVAPGASATVPFQIVPSQWSAAPPLGLMVVVQDNQSGAGQATLLPIRLDH